MKQRELEQQGLDPTDAAVATRRALGSVALAHDQARDVWIWPWLQDICRDVRFAMRLLAKDRRFTVVAVLTLTLGIGASTVIFSLVYALVFDAFPYRDSDRIVTFAIHNLANAGGSAGRNWYTLEEFLAFREQNHVFEDMVGYSARSDVLYSDDQGTRQLPPEAFVTTNTFPFYGVSPLIGRGIAPDDGRADAPPVFVMDYRLWRAQFDGDPHIVGKTLVLNGEPRTLVGIMPPRFHIYGAGLWVPAGGDLGPGGLPMPTGQGTLEIVGRLKRGVSIRTASEDLDVIAHRLTEHEPRTVMNPDRYSIVVRTLTDVVLGDFKAALYTLAAAVAMLLLIACANVASLLLARATARETEIAVRASLGASRGRLVRQLVVESFVLSAMGCVAGCALAYAGVKGVRMILPSGRLPPEAVIGFSAPVLLFAAGATVLTTLLCGLAPALHAVGLNLGPRLTASSKGCSRDVRHGTIRAALVITEVALSIVLLIGAGLMLRSVFALTRADLPFEPSRLLYVRLSLPRDRYYGRPDRKPALFQQVLPRIEALPGVMAATETLMLPPDEGSWTDVDIPGKPHSERWDTDIELCTAGYFQTLGLRVLRGTLFSERDVTAASRVVVVNQTLVRQYFGHDDPVGQKIKFEVFDRPFVDAPHNTYFEIIGVVTDFQSRPGRTKYLLKPEAFIPASVAGFGRPLHIVARTQGDPRELLKRVEQEVWAADPTVAISASGSIADVLNMEFEEPRFQLTVLGAFAGIGLLLVVIGVFGVMAYTVALRTHEIGVRMALGAQQADIARMVLGKGFGLLVGGIAVGMCASVGLTRFLNSRLWGVSPTDPETFFVVFAVIVIAGLLACALPARRAARIDPLTALRYE
jgi:putative ABC transport system permease protein